MPQEHHQPAGDGPDSATQVLATIRSRTRYAATASRWLARAADIIADLRTQHAIALADAAALHDEVVMLRRIVARRAGGDPNTPPPPPDYIDALRSPQLETYRPVEVDIDGQPWTVGFARHRAVKPDPEHELRCWGALVATARAVRGSVAVEA